MHIITIEDKLANLPEHWRQQYGRSQGKWYDENKRQIYQRLLAAMPLTVQSASAIIGNGSWTNISCSQCGKRNLDRAIEVGEEQDYESATAWLCEDCLRQAWEMMQEYLAKQQS